MYIIIIVFFEVTERKACSSEWRNHFLSVPNNSKNGVQFLNIFGSQKFFFVGTSNR